MLSIIFHVIIIRKFGIMDLQAKKKLDLIRWLTSLNDDKVLSKLYAIKSKNQSNDWYDELPQSQKNEIAKGLNDLENGYIVSHEDVMSSASRRISELKNQ